MDTRDFLAAAQGSLARTESLVAVLRGDQWQGPRLDIVNPPRWEVGHLGWFWERFVLRGGLGLAPLMAASDHYYDSIAIAHHQRSVLEMPDPEAALDYLRSVLAAVQKVAASEQPGSELWDRLLLGLFHHDMHNEAFAYSWQTLGYPLPFQRSEVARANVPLGDLAIRGGTVTMGATGVGFAFDNERPAMTVECPDFAMSRHAVTEGEFSEFVTAGGYHTESLWTAEGLRWLQSSDRRLPRYWRREGSGFEVREFDGWRGVLPERAMVHVCRHEAEAFAAWAGRRLPTEVEWEVAAREHPDSQRTGNFDWSCGGVVDADTGAAHGPLQLFGNVWEWTSSTFEPYPGFEAGIYPEYSAPWFGTRSVVRGGAWCTPSYMMWPSLRNYYEPHRDDIWAGFRTCARP